MNNKGIKIFLCIILVMGVLGILVVTVPMYINYRIHEFYRIPPIDTLRVVWDAQKAFAQAEGGYTGSWKELRDVPIASGKKAYLDIDLSGIVEEYKYTLQPNGDSLMGKKGGTVYTDFICVAEPVDYDKLLRSFMIDSTGVIRFENGKAANKDSAPI